MAWDLKGNLDEEIERALVSADHTPEQVAELFPAYDYEAQHPIVGQGAVVDGVFEQDATTGGTRNPERPAYTAGQRDQLASLHRVLTDLPELVGKGDGIGSNSWVVDGAHSETGQPLLANDPHLGVSVPGIWVQMGLHCTTVSAECPLDVAGFTFSGVPGVIIGHNADIAWGFTNLGPDVTDLYLERVTDDQWEQDGRLRPLDDARGDHPGAAARTTSRSRCARPGTGRSSATGSTSTATWPRRSAGPVRDRTRPAARHRERHLAGLDGPHPVDDRRRDPRPQHRHRLDELPRGGVLVRRTGAEPRVRRPRRPHRVPGARPDPDPQVRQRRPRAAGGLAERERLDRRLRAVRRAAERARPRRGFRRHREPGGHRAGVPLLPDRRLGPRLPLGTDPRPAGEAGRALGRRHVGHPARHAQPARGHAGPAAAGDRPAARLRLGRPADAPQRGTSTRPRTARRRSTSTWSGATCSS